MMTTECVLATWIMANRRFSCWLKTWKNVCNLMFFSCFPEQRIFLLTLLTATLCPLRVYQSVHFVPAHAYYDEVTFEINWQERIKHYPDFLFLICVILWCTDYPLHSILSTVKNYVGCWCVFVYVSAYIYVCISEYVSVDACEYVCV